MSTWRIRPEGVKQVLISVDAEATLLADSLKNLEADFGTAITAGQSQAVADAVKAWMETESPGLEKVSQRIQASIIGARDATLAYIAGDEEMAAQAQAAQVAAA